jgi:nitrate reductase NapAB chaperone NapD
MWTPPEPEPQALLSISGVALVCKPEAFPAVLACVGELEGVEVHAADAETGRAVLTIETDHPRAQVRVLEGIQRLPGVLLAEMAFHGVEPVTPTHPDGPLVQIQEA